MGELLVLKQLYADLNIQISNMKKLLALLLLSPLAVIANSALASNEDDIWQYLQYLLGVALIFFLYAIIKSLYEFITEKLEENKKLSEEKNNTNVDINQEIEKLKNRIIGKL